MYKLFSLVIVMTVFVSLNVCAGILMDGTYKGQGTWVSDTEQKDYDVETIIKWPVIQTTYTFLNGDTKSWSMTLVPTTKSFFKIIMEDNEVGNGYCINFANVCHYTVQLGAYLIEETAATLANSKINRFGSFVTDTDQNMRWEEQLAQE